MGTDEKQITQPSLCAARHALYDYLAETDRYLIGYKGAGPLPEDLCCDYHRGKWEQNEEIRANLNERRDGIVAAIREIEALIPGARFNV